MTDVEWEKTFHKALVAAGYTLKDSESLDMYVEVVKYLSDDILYYICQREKEWNSEWFQAVTNELIERSLLIIEE